MRLVVVWMLPPRHFQAIWLWRVSRHLALFAETDNGERGSTIARPLNRDPTLGDLRRRMAHRHDLESPTCSPIAPARDNRRPMALRSIARPTRNSLRPSAAATLSDPTRSHSPSSGGRKWAMCIFRIGGEVQKNDLARRLSSSCVGANNLRTGLICELTGARVLSNIIEKALYALHRILICLPSNLDTAPARLLRDDARELT